MKTDQMIIGAPEHPENFSIILSVEMRLSHEMLGKHIMRKAKLVDCQCQVTSSVDKTDIMQINA